MYRLITPNSQGKKQWKESKKVAFCSYSMPNPKYTVQLPKFLEENRNIITPHYIFRISIAFWFPSIFPHVAIVYIINPQHAPRISSTSHPVTFGQPSRWVRLIAFQMLLHQLPDFKGFQNGGFLGVVETHKYLIYRAYYLGISHIKVLGFPIHVA